jgi:hypothetical protein
MAVTTAKNLIFNPKPIQVRIEDEVYERLKAAARASLRSVNAEIALRLRNSVREEAGGPRT